MAADGLVDTEAIKNKMRDECSHPSHDDAIASVDGIFAPFDSLPDPSSFDTILTNLESAMSVMCATAEAKDPVTGAQRFANPAFDLVASLGGELDEWNWKGDAYETYRDNVEIPFPRVADNLYAAVSVLYAAVEAEKALWTAVRNDLKDIGEKAISAADKICDSGAGSAAFWLTCGAAVVAVAGVALAPVTAGASTAMTIAVVGGVFSIAAAGTQVDWDIETPEELVSAMQSSVDTVKETITEKEGLIQESLQSLHSALGGAGLFTLPTGISLASGPGSLTGRD